MTLRTYRENENECAEYEENISFEKEPFGRDTRKRSEEEFL